METERLKETNLLFMEIQTAELDACFLGTPYEFGGV